MVSTDKVQRVGAGAVTSAVRGTSLQIAEIEAGFETTDARLGRKVASHLLRAITVPMSNPLFSNVTKSGGQPKSYRSSLGNTARILSPIMDWTPKGPNLTPEIITTTHQTLWQEEMEGCRAIGLDGTEEETMARVGQTKDRPDGRRICPDASVRDVRCAIIVFRGRGGQHTKAQRVSIQCASDLTTAESMAIGLAFLDVAAQQPRLKNVVINTYSDRVTRQILEPQSRPDQYIAQHIRQYVE